MPTRGRTARQRRAKYISSPIRSRDVRKLPCGDRLKEVIHRCLGVRGKRYEAASAGKRLSSTGFLSRPRSEAIKAAK